MSAPSPRHPPEQLAGRAVSTMLRAGGAVPAA
jgi:hypothetical protein